MRYRMLSVDLSSGSFEVSDVTDLFRDYLGGTGALTRLALDLLRPEIDPLSPEAQVLIGVGPFAGFFPAASKAVALFRSPLNGDLGESHAGGKLALAMVSAGFHVLRITGRAPSPVYLSVKDEEVKLVPCSSLWGRSAPATERILREREETPRGKESIARIGPAGERMSPMACVTVDSSRHFGRLGLGAVWGSKNLKALVISGSKSLEPSDWRGYNALYKELFDLLARSEVSLKYRDLGTAGNVLPLSATQSLPTRNFSQGFFEGAEGISGELLAERFLSQQMACAHCPIGCIHVAQLREMFASPHMFKTTKVSYDHELLYALGSNLGISRADEVLRLLIFVEKQGWDAISVGVTLAWATEAFQRGVLGLSDTEGLVLSFGDFETYMEVLRRMASGSGELYRNLDKGLRRCVGRYGGGDFAITFGGLEAPGYMTGPSAFVGYAVGVRHSHLDCAGYAVDQKFFGKEPDPEAEARELHEEALWRSITNSLVTCLFARGAYSRDRVLKGLEVLGFEETESSLSEKAQAILGMKHLLKERLGFSFEDRRLPRKLLGVYTGRGPVSEEDFSERLRIYASLVEEDKRKAKALLEGQ